MSSKEIERATSLANAINLGRVDVVRATLRNGISPDAPTQGGASVLRVAVAKDCVESVRLLLDAGADPSRPDKLGYTPLGELQSVRVARLLVAAGADLDAPCFREWTPLEMLARKMYLEVMEVLLQAGARIPQKMQRPEYWSSYGAPGQEALRMILSHATTRSIEAAMPDEGEPAGQSRSAEASPL